MITRLVLAGRTAGDAAGRVRSLERRGRHRRQNGHGGAVTTLRLPRPGGRLLPRRRHSRGREPAPGGAGAGAAWPGRRDRRVLRVARRRLPVPEPHRWRRRRRPAGRAQPGVPRARAPAAADDRLHLAQRPGLLRRLPAVLPGARDRPPVLGPGRGLEELPRAVDQRGIRPVLRLALRRAPRRARRGARHRLAPEKHGRWPSPGRARSSWATGSGTSGATAGCSARSSTTRRRSSCTCCGGCSATRRSSGACSSFYRDSRFLKVGTDEVREAFERASGRPLDRFFERWIREFAVPTRPLRHARWTATPWRSCSSRPAEAVHDLPGDRDGRVRLRGQRHEVVVAVTEARTTAARSRSRATVRRVDVNEDDAALARFEKMYAERRPDRGPRRLV